MKEVVGILIAVAAMIVGILVIGWAYGDFRPEPRSGENAGREQTPGTS